MTFVICLLLLVPGFYAYFGGLRFPNREKTDEFALDYYKYRLRSGSVLWIFLILFFILPPLLLPGAGPLDDFYRFTLGLGPLVIFFISYTFFLLGFSLIDRRVRHIETNILVRLQFDLGLLFLMLWPYILLIALITDGSYYWLKAALVITSFLPLYFFTPAFWTVFFGARPPLEAIPGDRLAAIAAKLNIEPVRLLIFSDRGLKAANAFTIGNWHADRAVFMTEYAYANLDPDEIAAIYAHEIGHLQPHQTIRRSVAFGLPLIIIPAVNGLFPQHSFFLSVGMLIATLILVKLLVPSQRFEKEADSFALQATSDAPALISGLEKIYRLASLPKYFRPAEESKYTHPSLAQRIRLIKKMAGQDLPQLAEPKQFAATGEFESVQFQLEALAVRRRGGQVRVTPYRDIVAIYPAKAGERTAISVRYRDDSRPKKITLDARYDEIFAIVDIVAFAFADYPAVEPHKFRREKFILSILAVLVGAISAFFTGPALFVIGFIGFFEKNRRIFLAHFIACLAAISALLTAVRLEPELERVLLFLYGLIALLALSDHYRFSKLVQNEAGRGAIIFYVSALLSFLQLVVISRVIIAPVSIDITRIYGILCLNFTALALGLLLLRRLADPKRWALAIYNIVALAATFIFLIKKA